MSKFYNDTRAGAGNTLNFLIALALSAGMGYMMYEFSQIIIPMAYSSTDSPKAIESIGYSELAVHYWPLIALISCCIYLIVAEIVDRRIGL